VVGIHIISVSARTLMLPLLLHWRRFGYSKWLPPHVTLDTVPEEFYFRRGLEHGVRFSRVKVLAYLEV